MNERQRWRPEEDAVLCGYVKEYGPREWHLVSQRMNVSLNRDAKSCLERWKNYLKPGIKTGSLTEEEKGLVIRLQAEHGNKWKRIAAEVPGRTPKRLGKWWEVYKERQHREEVKENKGIVDPITEQQRRYDRILEFAEKLVKERSNSPLMVTSNGFLPSDPPAALLPPWLSSSSSNGRANPVRPPSPSVALTLSPSTVPWLPQPAERPSSDNNNTNSNLVVLGNLGHQVAGSVDGSMASELVECFRELEEGHRAWMAHKKETAWRLRRVELQLESEKATKRREKMEETESKVKALREEQRATLERIEAEYKEQILGLRRDAEAKEQKLVEQWTAKHLKVAKFLEQMGCRMPGAEPQSR